MSNNRSRDQSITLGIPIVKVGNELYISPHFGRAPFFTIVEIAVTSNNYRIVEVIQNPYTLHGHGKGRNIVDILMTRNINAVITMNIGYGAFHRLKERNIDVYLIPIDKEKRNVVPLSRAIEMFINKQLEEAKEPRELE
ncbi:MAG: NifB/NifX family molybdenum-iron cluster-binding protein [Desulfurococcaceae archaeon]|nr:NifB/NifX family molybdenum-iron cluster-binding protein [Desulfurococcaceae archaeon]